MIAGGGKHNHPRHKIIVKAGTDYIDIMRAGKKARGEEEKLFV
jgi:hypothetical protein